MKTTINSLVHGSIAARAILLVPAAFLLASVFLIPSVFLMPSVGVSEDKSASRTPAEIYVVDIQKVISQSEAGKASKLRMEGEIKQREGRLKTLKDEVDKMKSDLTTQASILSADAVSAKQDVIEKKERELQRAFQDQDEDLLKKNNSEVGKIVAQIDGIIQDLVKENHYKFVVERDLRFVLYVDPKYDLTDKVTSLLDKRAANS